MMDHIKFMKVVKKLVVDKLNNKVRWSHLSALSRPCRRNFYMSNVHFQSPPSHVHSCRLTRESTRWSENWHEKHKIWAVNFWQTATFLDSCCQCDVRWELPGQACVCMCVRFVICKLGICKKSPESKKLCWQSDRNVEENCPSDFPPMHVLQALYCSTALQKKCYS